MTHTAGATQMSRFDRLADRQMHIPNVASAEAFTSQGFAVAEGFVELVADLLLDCEDSHLETPRC